MEKLPETSKELAQNSSGILQSIIWLAVTAVLCGIIFTQINWAYVLGAVGFGVFWLLLALGVFLVGFISKTIVGIFSKRARDASTEDFMDGAATRIGLVLHLIFFIIIWGIMIIGLPLAIISALLGAGK